MLERFESFTAGIAVCYKYLQRIKSVEMTEFGLKGTQAMCLFYLYHSAGGMTAAQLAERCVEDKAAISRTLAELKQRGYLTWQETKRYRAPIVLTEEGRALAARMDMDGIIAGWISAGGAGLTEEERQCFYSALERIANNLKERMNTK